MVAAGFQDFDILRGHKSQRIDILTTHSEDGLLNVAMRFGGGRFAEGILSKGPPGLGGLNLGFNYFGHEFNGIGMQAGDRLAFLIVLMSRFRLGWIWLGWV